MQNLILIVHLILAICLIAAVLFQRSEGGALGIGGGGGGLVSQRGAGTALSKLTWVLGIAFFCTSILLVIVSDGTGGSLLEQIESGGDVPLPGAATTEDETVPLPDFTLPGAAE